MFFPLLFLLLQYVLQQLLSLWFIVCLILVIPREFTSFNSLLIVAGGSINHNKNAIVAAPSNNVYIYAITPTYKRDVQISELTRLSHIIQIQKQIHWIIVEDSSTQSKFIDDLLFGAKLKNRSTHLNIKTIESQQTKHLVNVDDDDDVDDNVSGGGGGVGGKVSSILMNNNNNNEREIEKIRTSKSRGVDQRNFALEYIRFNKQKINLNSVVYFMDDDNTYSQKLFNEMLKIKNYKIAIWPVGFSGGMISEGPICNLENTKIIGFNSDWRSDRSFPIDMAGFAIGTALLINRNNVLFSYERGMLETTLLEQMTTVEQLQILKITCDLENVVVWHTRTQTPHLNKKKIIYRNHLL